MFSGTLSARFGLQAMLTLEHWVGWVRSIPESNGISVSLGTKYSRVIDQLIGVIVGDSETWIGAHIGFKSIVLSGHVETGCGGGILR